MQMKNDGITLMSLVVTAIVLIIIAGISFKLGTDSIQTSRKYLLQSSVNIISTAVVQQGGKMSTLKYNSLPITEEKPEGYYGEPIGSFSDINTGKLTEEEKNDLKTSLANFNSDGSYKKLEHHEDYYYRVGKTELEQLGITNDGATYIVNYSTGEAFNETTQVAVGEDNDDRSLLYFKPGQPDPNEEVDPTFSE